MPCSIREGSWPPSGSIRRWRDGASATALKGAAFVLGNRVSQAKGDPIDSAVPIPVEETAARRSVPGHRIPGYRFDGYEQTRMSAPPFQASVRGIA